MKYTVYLELSFDDKAVAKKILNGLNLIRDKVYRPNGSEIIKMEAKAEIWETRHDDVPPVQCRKLGSYDFDTGTIKGEI